MNVWVFGDSYTDLRHGLDGRPLYFEDQWFQRVANAVGGKVRNFGVGGSSLDWVYKNVFDNIDNIQNGDTVLISLTGFQRRWLLKDYPEHSFWRSSLTNNPDENTAFKYYTLYLDNPIPYEYYLLTFLNSLNAISKELNLHTVLLHCFGDLIDIIIPHLSKFPFLNMSIGTLVQISYDEYTEEVNEQRENKWDMKMIESESLLNHLLRSNHIILANKIIDNIKNNTPIDLTSGFKSRLITEDSFTDYNFCVYEGFDFPINLRMHSFTDRDLTPYKRHKD